ASDSADDGSAGPAHTEVATSATATARAHGTDHRPERRRMRARILSPNRCYDPPVMNCPRCGRQNAGGARTCAGCGTRLSVPDDPATRIDSPSGAGAPAGAGPPARDHDANPTTAFPPRAGATGTPGFPPGGAP